MSSIVLIIICVAFICLTVMLAKQRHLLLTGLSTLVAMVSLFSAWQSTDGIKADPDHGESRDAITSSAGQPTAEINVSPTP